MVSVMRRLRAWLAVAAAMVSSGCFQMTTVLKVAADGSGTIEHRMLYSPAALVQLRQFSALAGGGQTFDPLSEQQAREMTASIGPGVTYVSSEPISTPAGQGRASIYAFTDDEVVFRQLLLPWGVEPFLMPFSDDPEKTILDALAYLKLREWCDRGTWLVVITNVLAHEKVIDSLQLRQVE